MKRLMIIGGGPNQLSLINAALGDYDVFLCDGSDHPLGKALVPEDRFLHADISKPDIVA